MPSACFSLKNLSLSLCLAGGGGIETTDGGTVDSTGSGRRDRISGRLSFSPGTDLCELGETSDLSTAQAFPFRILEVTTSERRDQEFTRVTE